MQQTCSAGCTGSISCECNLWPRGRTDTHTHAHTHTDFTDKSNFKKPGACRLNQRTPGLQGIQGLYIAHEHAR